jgi:hypothetical protein
MPPYGSHLLNLGSPPPKRVSDGEFTVERRKNNLRHGGSRGEGQEISSYMNAKIRTVDNLPLPTATKTWPL